MNIEPELIENEDEDPLIAQVPVGNFDAAVILDPVDDNLAYVIEQVAGNRFNLFRVDIAKQTQAGNPVPFGSLAEALQNVAEQVD